MTTRRQGLKRRRRALVGEPQGESPRTKETPPFQLQDASVGGRGLQPEFQSADWQRIREAAYEGRGG